MKTNSSSPSTGQRGTALLVTMVLTGIALITVGGIMTYSGTGARLDSRACQYQRAVEAAEAATEKVLAQLSRDYLSGGEALVNANLSTYQNSSLSPADSSYWTDWQFTDASGHPGRTFVGLASANSYIVLNSTYAGLKGYASTYTVVSNARENGLLQDVVGAVAQQVQLARIPIFQFAMYSSGDMEISCGQPFTVTGRVHCNGQLYIEPDNLLTFQSTVTSVGDTMFERAPSDSRGLPVGSVLYEADTASHVPALTLPIGATNTPAAVREIIEPPPSDEDPSSPMGRLRYYNEADMMLVATNLGTNFVVTGSSGRFNNFGIPIPATELNSFVSTSGSFFDSRESQTVLPIDIDIAALTAWSATNVTVRAALGSRNISSVYVLDARTLPAGSLGAVRLSKGTQLPADGLTIATSRPLYVWGNYNQSSSINLGGSNTTTTVPASLVADAITILSPNWTDANSTSDVGSRTATPITVNAALLSGTVETADGFYGGGMENFPRFLETWGLANQFTFNGSMVKMFASRYATNTWGQPNVYAPPKRNWAYDLNFEDPAKLPPLTPGLYKVVRSRWATLAPFQTALPASL